MDISRHADSNGWLTPPQNLTVKQLDARIIEARMWLASDSPLPWGEVGGDWCPKATAALTTSEEQANIDFPHG